MTRKSFLVKVELVVEKVSCPGVCLCSNGKLSLQLAMLDSTIQTDSRRPQFPLVFQEKFLFYKTYANERRLNELQLTLGREWIRAELVQWKNCDRGVVLANFQTTLDDLLYPDRSRSVRLAGANVDLLMEPTRLFPGTISPKLELRTNTTIEETVADEYGQRTGAERGCNCAWLASNASRRIHPKKVCHTATYSRAQQRSCFPNKAGKRPMFKYKRAEDDLIIRTNPNVVLKHDDVIKLKNDLAPQKCDNGIESKVCYCTPAAQQDPPYDCLPDVHQTNSCSVCSRYEGTFQFSTSTHQSCPCEEFDKRVCFCLPEKQEPAGLARKMQERLKNVIETGSECLESCLRDCNVVE